MRTSKHHSIGVTAASAIGSITLLACLFPTFQGIAEDPPAPCQGTPPRQFAVQGRLTGAPSWSSNFL
jgi:hypothetical protein